MLSGKEPLALSEAKGKHLRQPPVQFAHRDASLSLSMTRSGLVGQSVFAPLYKVQALADTYREDGYTAFRVVPEGC